MQSFYPVWLSITCHHPVEVQCCHMTQSLTGDTDQAMKTLHNYHQIWRQYGFVPEMYNIPKAEVHASREGYPLRPGKLNLIGIFVLVPWSVWPSRCDQKCCSVTIGACNTGPLSVTHCRHFMRYYSVSYFKIINPEVCPNLIWFNVRAWQFVLFTRVINLELLIEPSIIHLSSLEYLLVYQLCLILW